MEHAPHTIIVPVDGSRQANAATHHAGLMAGRLVAHLQLVHVFPGSPREMLERVANRGERLAVSYMNREQFDALRAESAERAFSAARKALPPESPRHEELIVPGEPAPGLIAHARLTESPLIIMGRRGLGTIRELLLGSVSERVVHYADCPVTVLAGDRHVGLPSVLVVPVDGSSHAGRAAGHAAELATATGAKIKLVHVHPKRSAEIPGVGAGIAGLSGVAADVEKRLAEMGSTASRIAFESARAAMPERLAGKLEEVSSSGNVDEAILRAAAEEPGSAIVMGRRGLGRMRELMLGSISQRVLHHAECPVTVVS